MGFFKKLLKKKDIILFEELAKDSFFTDLWIDVSFRIVLNFPKDTKVKDMIDIVEKAKKDLLGTVSKYTVPTNENPKNISCINEPPIEKGVYSTTFKIRYKECSYAYDENGEIQVVKAKREYGFSPIEFVQYIDALFAISNEFEKILNLNASKNTLVQLTLNKGKPHYMFLNNILFIDSPIEKMKLLNDKEPVLFKMIYGSTYDEIIKLIMSYKDEPSLKKYYAELKKII